jgi:parallel beta-helix repeat protein
MVTAALAAIASALVAASSVAQSATGNDIASYEAESFTLPSQASIVSDSAASGGKAVKFSSNGTATKSVTTTDEASTVVVVARGPSYGGRRAELEVKLDGVDLLPRGTRLRSDAYERYEAARDVPAGSHTLAIRAKDVRSSRPLYADVYAFSSEEAPPPPAEYSLLESDEADRSPSGALSGSTQSGESYVFTAPDTEAITRVDFYLDGEFVRSEAQPPYDFAGGSSTFANAWDTTSVSDGEHTILAKISKADGTSVDASATFTVENVVVPPPPTDPPTGECDKWASPTGSDANAGTEAAPYRTAERLANALSAGQTGCLRSGTYTEGDKVVSVTNGGTATARKTLTTDPAATQRARINARLVVSDAADYFTLDNLRLDGSYGPTCTVAGEQEACASPMLNGDYGELLNSEITNRRAGQESLGGICIHSSHTSLIYGLVIRDNSIHQCGYLPASNHDHGIYLHDTRGALIEGNLIWDNSDRGIQLRKDADGSLIQNNVIDHNGQGILFGGTSGSTSDNNEVRNNLITFSKGNTVQSAKNITSFYEGTSPATGNTVHHNCIYGVASGGTNINTTNGGFSATNNTIADPLYTNRANGDFSLREGSPCASILNGG